MSYLICRLCHKFFWSRIRIPESCWIVPELRIYFKFCPLVHLFHTHPSWNFSSIVIIVHWVEQTLAFYVFLFSTLRGRLNLKRLGWSPAQHNKRYHRKELLSGSHLNGHTIGFHAHTQKFEPLTSAILRRSVSRTSLFFLAFFSQLQKLPLWLIYLLSFNSSPCRSYIWFSYIHFS